LLLFYFHFHEITKGHIQKSNDLCILTNPKRLESKCRKENTAIGGALGADTILNSAVKNPTVTQRWWLLPAILATWDAEIGRTMVQAQPRANSSYETPSPNNQRKMDWRCGSQGRAPALQVQSQEFKPQAHQK
jgi:hypothetical protein